MALPRICARTGGIFATMICARLKAEITTPLNFEMAATDEMVGIAPPDPAACLLPRAGKTQRAYDRGRSRRDQRPRSFERPRRNCAGLDPRSRCSSNRTPQAVEAARSIGAPVVELHTGPGAMRWRTARRSGARHEFERLKLAAKTAASLGIECHAGHGLGFRNRADHLGAA